MKASFTLSAIAVFMLLGTGSLRAADLSKAQCPVSGRAVKEGSSVDYKGKKVYFCCNNCPKAFKKDTEKFASKANQQLFSTGQATQVACPLSGKSKLDAKMVVKVGGVPVTFCCGKCCGKVGKASPEEQLALVFANFSKGFTTQTSCPMSGKAINPVCFSDHKGKNVYFCCGKCKKAFDADPAKFADKLK